MVPVAVDDRPTSYQSGVRICSTIDSSPDMIKSALSIKWISPAPVAASFTVIVSPLSGRMWIIAPSVTLPVAMLARSSVVPVSAAMMWALRVAVTEPDEMVSVDSVKASEPAIALFSSASVLMTLPNAVTFAELIASASVRMGSECLVLCFAHSSWFEATAEPSSAGGLESYPLIVWLVYGEFGMTMPSYSAPIVGYGL